MKKIKVIGEKRVEEDGYILLAGAILKQAASDYKRARRILDTSYDDKKIWNARHKKKEIERFFRSSWADLLCMGHADYIFEQIKKDYAEEKAERERVAEEKRLKKMRHDVTNFD